jgi:hypothetical protein
MNIKRIRNKIIKSLSENKNLFSKKDNFIVANKEKFDFSAFTIYGNSKNEPKIEHTINDLSEEEFLKFFNRFYENLEIEKIYISAQIMHSDKHSLSQIVGFYINKDELEKFAMKEILKKLMYINHSIQKKMIMDLYISIDYSVDTQETINGNIVPKRFNEYYRLLRILTPLF